METKHDVGEKVFVISKCENVIVNACFSECRNICPFENDCDFESCNDNNFNIFETTIDSIFITKEYEHYGFEGLSECGIESECGQYEVFPTYEQAEKRLNEILSGINNNIDAESR